MTINRLITTLIQLGLLSVCYYGIKSIYFDIKENGFFPKEEN
jgi:hypothetical protein